MFLAHSIRLRDPWQCEPTPAGGLRWSRVFHRPTGLEPDDDLWLVISCLPPAAEVTVNRHPFPNELAATRSGASEAQEAPESPPDLPPQKLPSRYDLTPILTDKNEIEILLPPSASPLAPGESPPASPVAFPYDARLAVMARS